MYHGLRNQAFEHCQAHRAGSRYGWVHGLHRQTLQRPSGCASAPSSSRHDDGADNDEAICGEIKDGEAMRGWKLYQRWDDAASESGTPGLAVAGIMCRSRPLSMVKVVVDNKKV
jgi:hypothetical protein